MKNSKRELILTALLSNPTVREASAAVGVPEQTIYSWLRKPEFKAEYEKRKRELMDDTRSYLQVRLQEANAVVFSIMHDSEAPSQTRLNAARTVFEYCANLTEQADIISRLDVLEAIANDDNRR